MRLRRTSSIASLATPGGFHDGDWVESKDQDPDGGIRLLQLADIGDGVFRDRSSKWINHAAFERLNCSWVHPGDLLIARMPDPIGRACIVPSDIGDAITVVDVAVLRCDPARAENRYVKYAINESSTRHGFEAVQDGATRQRIPRKVLGRSRIPLPSIEHQRAIADFLDEQTSRIDTLIDKQTQLIATLRERRAALISHFVEPHEPNTTLRRHLTSIRQGSSPNCYAEPADGVEEWGVLKTGCSNGGAFRPAENKKLPEGEEPRREHAVVPGEIIMSRASSREYVGSPAAVKGSYPKLLLSDLNYGLAVRPTLNSDYAVYALSGRRARWEIESRAKGTSPSMQKLSQGDILGLPIFVPAVGAQAKIVKHLDEQTATIDTLIAKTEQHIALAKERRSALITAAVTGQIDVRTAGRIERVSA